MSVIFKEEKSCILKKLVSTDYFHFFTSHSFLFFKRFYLLSERGEGREKERERDVDGREKH